MRQFKVMKINILRSQIYFPKSVKHSLHHNCKHFSLWSIFWCSLDEPGLCWPNKFLLYVYFLRLFVFCRNPKECEIMQRFTFGKIVKSKPSYYLSFLCFFFTHGSLFAHGYWLSIYYKKTRPLLVSKAQHYLKF